MNRNIRWKNSAFSLFIPNAKKKLTAFSLLIFYRLLWKCWNQKWKRYRWKKRRSRRRTKRLIYQLSLVLRNCGTLHKVISSTFFQQKFRRVWMRHSSLNFFRRLTVQFSRSPSNTIHTYEKSHLSLAFRRTVLFCSLPERGWAHLQTNIT